MERELGADEVLRVQVITIDNVSIEVKSNYDEVESFTRPFSELTPSSTFADQWRQEAIVQKTVKSNAIVRDNVINIQKEKSFLIIFDWDALQNDKLLLLFAISKQSTEIYLGIKEPFLRTRVHKINYNYKKNQTC